MILIEYQSSTRLFIIYKFYVNLFRYFHEFLSKALRVQNELEGAFPVGQVDRIDSQLMSQLIGRYAIR